MYLKKIILSFLLCYVSYNVNAQKITDYHIGMKLEGNDMVHLTVGTISGVLFLYPDKYGYIFSMGFVPSNDGKNPTVYQHGTPIGYFVKTLEGLLNIRFEKKTYKTVCEVHYTAKYKGNQMVVSGDYEGEKNENEGPYKFSMMLTKL